MLFNKFFIFGFLVAAGSWALAFPILSEWQNAPVIAFENKTQAVLKKNTELRAPFALATANRDKAVVTFNK